MALTTTSDLSALMKTYYDKKLLAVARPVMVADQFADKSRDIPQHEGQVVRFTRYVPLARETAPIDEGQNPTPQKLQAVSFEATVKKYAKSVALTEEIQLTAFDDVLDAAVEELGQNMGLTVNYLYRQAMTYFYPLRADNSSTYAKTYTVSSPTTSSVVLSSASETDNFWCDGRIVFLSGINAGMSARITGWNATTKTLTFSPALSVAPSAGDKVRLVVTTNLNQNLTCAAVERAVALLKSFNAPKFQGKWYIGIISPFVAYDLMNDDRWVDVNKYAGAEQIFEGELGMWGGVRFIEDTDPWRELPCDGTAAENPQDRGIGCYNENGTIYSTPIFGAHAYAGVSIEGVRDKLIIKKPGPQDTSNPINAYSTVSWRIYFTAVCLNALFGVNILSTASTVE
jgi:hypothetical protein